VNRSIMKLDGKNIICVLNFWSFFSIVQFSSELWAFLIYIYYTHYNSLKNWIIVKKYFRQNTDNVLPHVCKTETTKAGKTSFEQKNDLSTRQKYLIVLLHYQYTRRFVFYQLTFKNNYTYYDLRLTSHNIMTYNSLQC